MTVGWIGEVPHGGAFEWRVTDRNWGCCRRRGLNTRPHDTNARRIEVGGCSAGALNGVQVGVTYVKTMAICRVGEYTGRRTYERPCTRAGSSRTHLVDGIESPVPLHACPGDGIEVLVTGVVVVTAVGVCEQTHCRTGERWSCCDGRRRRPGAWRHSAHFAVRVVSPCAVHACSEVRHQTAVARVEVVAVGRVREYPNSRTLERIWSCRDVTGTLSNGTQNLRLSQGCCRKVTCDTMSLHEYFPTFRKKTFNIKPSSWIA